MHLSAEPEQPVFKKIRQIFLQRKQDIQRILLHRLPRTLRHDKSGLHPAGTVLPVLSAPYRLHRTYRYGKIGLTIYRRDQDQQNGESVL